MSSSPTLREVVSHLLYGVDRTTDGVELCKVALLDRSTGARQPSPFSTAISVAARLSVCLTTRCSGEECRNEAYKPLTGDDKETQKAYAKFNKQQRTAKE